MICNSLPHPAQPPCAAWPRQRRPRTAARRGGRVAATWTGGRCGGSEPDNL